MSTGITFTDAYVGGRWIPGSEGPRVVLDPATGESFAEVSVSSIAQCLAAVDAAEAAFLRWAQTAPRARSEILRRAYELMVDEAEVLARLIVLENGKVLDDARSEIAYAAEFFRWFAEEGVRVSGDLRRSPAGHNWIMVSHEPVGVSLLVTPWNFPAAMATRKIAPALAAGCAVVLKPAIQTPLTALALADLLERAGVPAGVVNVITPAPAGPAAAALLRDRPVRALSFTGSTEGGRILLGEAAGNVVKCSMELGGNAPFIVFDDADLDAAVDGLMLAKMRNGGAACTAANRIFVQRRIADDLTERLIERMRQLKLGSGLDARSNVGPMVSRAELDRLSALVDATVDTGAKAYRSDLDVPGHGFFYPPTVLCGIGHDAAILDHEIFGPVAPVIEFDSVDEAIELANSTHAGLVAYLYTTALDRGLAVSRRLQAGMVGLNRGVVSDPAAPFGGVKSSGLGREGSSEGIHEFLETKYVATPYV